MATAEDFEEQAFKLAERLKGETVGETTVVDALAFVGLDSEEALSIFLQLILNDAQGETWPTEDSLDIRRIVMEVGRELGMHGATVYVRLIPQSAAETADDDGRAFA